MKIVLIRDNPGKTSTLWLPLWARLTLSCCLLGLPLSVGILTGASFFGDEESAFFDDVAEALSKDYDQQQQALDETRRKTETRLQALSLRMAQMQVQLARLEALGEVLTVQAELDDGEFDFSSMPAIGGPEQIGTGAAVSETQILQELKSLNWQIEDRQMQLHLVADLIQDRHLNEATRPSGLPVRKGWVSSQYGKRIDPFTGEPAWHAGVDIAGRKGSDVQAVAAGVISYAGERYGYGNLIEITHDNGYVTRYGHNEELLVKLGEIVKKGQLISRMGSTGRSTGPHVHFEVYKHGRTVDPARYIRGNIR